MDDRSSSLPLTIKSAPVATLLTQLSRKGSSLTTRLSLPISQNRFPLPTLARSPGETPKEAKEIKNETKHMDHADSWFSVVRSDYPGRTDSIEE
jgi:hypothetical protein